MVDFRIHRVFKFIGQLQEKYSSEDESSDAPAEVLLKGRMEKKTTKPSSM